MKAFQTVNYIPAPVFMSESRQWARLTSVNYLSPHTKEDLAVAGGVSHQIQNLFVRFAFYQDAIDANELIPGPQTTFFLGCSLGYDGTDVYLME